MYVKLQRIIDNGKQTLGKLVVCDNMLNPQYECWTLELPWRWNERNISCIPAGIYPASKFVSQKLGECIAIHNVPNRTAIRIHSGNFNTQIEGCILVGNDVKDINGDGQLDVLNSKATLKELLSILPDNFILDIRG